MAIVFFFKPYYGLLTVIFLLPFERIGSYALLPPSEHPVVRIVQIASASLVIAYCLRLTTRKLRPSHSLPALYLLAIGLLGLIPVLHYHYSQLNHNYLSAIGVFSIFYVVSQLTTATSLKRISYGLFASAAAVGTFGLFQYVGDIAGLPMRLTGLLAPYTKAVFGYPRIQATALEPLYYANYLLIPLLVGLALLIVTRRQFKWLPPVLALITINLILTMSRGGIFAATAGVIVLAVLLRKEITQLSQNTVRRFCLFLIGGLIIAAMSTAGASYLYYHNALKGPETFVELFTSKLTKTGSFFERQASQEQARVIFLKHPYFGVGFGGFGAALTNYPPKIAGNYPIANNAFWELLAELGLFGFGLLIAFVGTILWQGYRTFSQAEGLHRAYLAGLIAATVAIIIQYQSFTGFFLTHIWVCVAMLSGLTIIRHERPQTEPSKDNQSHKQNTLSLRERILFHRINTMKITARTTLLCLLALCLIYTPIRDVIVILFHQHPPHLINPLLKYAVELLPLGTLVLAIALNYRTIRARGKLPWAVWLTIMLLGWSVISIAYGTTGLWQSLRGLRADFGGLLAFLTIWIVSPTAREKRRLLQIMLGLMSSLMGISVVEFFINHQFRVWASQDLARHFVGSIPQLRSITPGPNPFGTLLVMAAALVLLLIFNRKQQLLAIFSVGLFLGLTQARSAWLAAAVMGAGIFGMGVAKRKINWAPLVLATAILFGSAIGVLKYHESLKMVLLHGQSTQEHEDISSGAVKKVVHRPPSMFLIGGGVGTAGPVTFNTKEGAVISENWYIQVAQEIGLIGLLIYLTLYLLTIRQAFIKKELVIAWLGIGLGINAFFLHTWSSDFNLNIIYWAILGLTLFSPRLEAPIIQHQSESKAK